MALEIEITDFVAAEKAPHKYAGVVQSLIEAGSDKVATVTVDDEETAKRFLTDMQAAARDAGMSAVKRVLAEIVDAKGKGTGKFTVSVAVRTAIKRERIAK